MRRILTTVLPIIIGIAIIGFFMYGLMQRPDIIDTTSSNTPVVVNAEEATTKETTTEETTTKETTTEESTTKESTTKESTTEESTTKESTTEDATTEEATMEPSDATAAVAEAPKPPAVTTYRYEVVNTYPHDPKAFLQGLVWEDDLWYEGTGLYGESTLRKVNPETGEVLQMVDLDASLFGEGITIFGEKIYQLTWKSQRGFIYDKDSFDLLEEFSYPTQGWGITHDGERLIMSDGTPNIYFLDPESLEQIGSIEVTNQGQPVRNLNELEYISGLIYANVWQTSSILLINPESGIVEGTVQLERNDLLSAEELAQQVDVLNGIAYDPATERLFVSGKLWPKIFEIKLIADQP